MAPPLPGLLARQLHGEQVGRRSPGGGRARSHHMEHHRGIGRVPMVTVGRPVPCPAVQLHVAPERRALQLQQGVLKVRAVARSRPARVDH